MPVPSLLLTLLALAPAQGDPPPAEAAITVQVLDALGKPVAGAAVHVEAEPRWGWDGKSYEFVPTVHDARTDKEGRFRFDPSVGVEYWIGVEPAGEPMALFELDRDGFRFPGGPVCRLLPLRTLRGRLLDSAGKPVAERAVHLVPDQLPQSFLAPVLPSGSILMECEDVGYAVAMNGPTGHPFERAILTTSTDEEGRWSFRARGGEVAVAAQDGEGVVQAAWRDLDTPEEEMTFRFQALATGSCQVLDAEGEPIAGALVYVARGAGWGDHSALCPVGATDESGEVRFTSLAGDASGVVVRHPEYPRWQVEDFHGERFDPGEPIVLPPQEDLGTLRIPVRDLHGNAVDSPRFRVLSWASELPGFPWLGKPERFRETESRRVESGVHEIVADVTSLLLVDSELHAPSAVLPIDAEQSGEELVAVLHPGRRYSFRALDGGQPVPGALIAPVLRYDTDSFDEEEEESHEQCGFAMDLLWTDLLTDADGRWTSPVICSALRLDFRIQHWDGRTEMVLKPQDENVEVDFGGPMVALTGRIVQDGVPLAGCELVVTEEWADSASVDVRVPIGADGSFSAKVHPGVPLVLGVDDHPGVPSSAAAVARLASAGDVGTIEANDFYAKPVQPPGRVTVKFPSTSTGFRPSVSLEVVPEDPADREACGETIYRTLLLNEGGEAGALLPAGLVTVRLDWPGPSFRVPHADYHTDAFSAVEQRLSLEQGQVLDLTETVELLIRQLEARKLE